MPDRGKGQRIRDKNRRYKTREKGKGTREMGRDIYPKGTKDYFWIQRR